MAGIQDIAKKAGVSISTVSYALNGSSKVTEKTRARIQKIAAEYNYSPNLAGRMLKKQKNFIIGLYLNDFGGYFYSHMIEGVNQVLAKSNYETIVATDGAQARDFIGQGLVDGAIILDTTFPDETIKRYAEMGKPIVVMDRQLSYQNVTQVLLNNQHGAQQAVRALIDAQISYLILVTGPKNSYDSIQRLQAALAESKKNIHLPVKVIQSDFTIAGGQRVADEISKINADTIGVFALNDEMAVGIINEIPTNLIGKKVKVIGFDNDIIGQYMTPGLSTIDYSKHNWGNVAAESLLNMIEGSVQLENQEIPTRIRHRQSLGEK